MISKESNLQNLPLTEAILQRLYKSKTYLHNEEWDVIWYLGGANNVTIGERSGLFFLLPPDFLHPAERKNRVVTDVLPFELIQGVHAAASSERIPLYTFADLLRVFPEFKGFQTK